MAVEGRIARVGETQLSLGSQPVFQDEQFTYMQTCTRLSSSPLQFSLYFHK